MKYITKQNNGNMNMTRYELEQEVKWLQETKGEMQALIDILWEYISEKDLNEINERLEKL